MPPEAPTNAASTPPVNPPGNPVSAVTLDQSSYSGITTARTAVARDGASWNALWTQHMAIVMPPPPAPAVDFTSRMVVAVFIGMRPNGCYGASITDVTQANSNTTVYFQEITPQPMSVCTQAVTAPSHIVSVPAASGTVEFLQIAPI